jgi:four helix bundle protein
MTPDEMKRRTKAFAVRCLRLADSLSGKPSGRTVANQLARCGTSVGANYRSACRARSKAEFLSKLGVVEEEADETGFWLEVVIEHGMKPASQVESLLAEADELTRIITASITTARLPIRNPQSEIRNTP